MTKDWRKRDPTNVHECYRQWRNDCPSCGKADCFRVVEARLVMTGDVIHPNTPLYPDGFIVDPDNAYDHLKDQSTEDERVKCENCDRIFDLSDLATKK